MTLPIDVVIYHNPDCGTSRNTLEDAGLSDEQLLDAMMAHPILINRPIVITSMGVRLCRPSETVLGILPGTTVADAAECRMN
jgi:arsenate reductase-like glutaredoxin family protein